MLPVLLGFLAALPPELLEPPPTVVQTVVGRIRDAKEYTLRVSIPRGGEQVHRFQWQENNEGTTWPGWRVVPYLVPLAVPPDGKGQGQVTLTFDFPGRKEATVLTSKGLAEDIYLLRNLVDEKAYAKWLAKVAPDSKLVVPWPAEHPPAPGEALEKVPAGLAAAVKLGQDAYEAKRPELVRRFNKSYLHYPPAAAKKWSVYTGKDSLAIETGCHDLMYYARFRVELTKTPKGDWEVTRILAGEFFKGE
jgi:hypothetical protein